MRPALLLIPIAASCTGPTTDAPADTDAGLVVADAWTPTAAAHDPFASHRPATIDCGPDGVYPELDGLEVDTGSCTYLAVTQGIGLDLAAGDTLDVTLFHGPLTAPDPAEAHVAIALGSDVLWQLTVPIPADAEPYTLSLPIDAPTPVGTPLHLHLHNHGANTWRWLSIERGRD